MTNAYLILTFMIVFVPVALLQTFMPMITRRTESFGVAIPSNEFKNPDIAAMRKTYAWASIILAVIALIIMIMLANFPPALPTILIAYLVLSFFVYLHFHNKMKTYKQKQNWFKDRKPTVIVDTSFRNQKRRQSNAWFIIGILIMLTTLTASFALYDKIPMKMPMHYDINGHVDRYVAKSYRAIIQLPVIQVYMLALFIFINTMIGRVKTQIDPERPEASVKKNIIFRRRWSAYIIATGTAVTLMMSLIQLTYLIKVNMAILNIVSMVIPAFIIIGAIVLSFSTGQGGSRIKLAKTDRGDTTFINRDDDRYWKLGQFYFNPKDPALFIEKRFGVGWTNNFAHPLSWLFIIGIIAIAVLIPLLLK